MIKKIYGHSIEYLDDSHLMFNTPIEINEFIEKIHDIIYLLSKYSLLCAYCELHENEHPKYDYWKSEIFRICLPIFYAEIKNIDSLHNLEKKYDILYDIWIDELEITKEINVEDNWNVIREIDAKLTDEIRLKHNDIIINIINNICQPDVKILFEYCQKMNNK
jgi:hypothetical protein